MNVYFLLCKIKSNNVYNKNFYNKHDRKPKLKKKILFTKLHKKKLVIKLS